MIVLFREPGGMTEYLTMDPEFTVGQSGFTFSSDPKIAFGFARRCDAEQFQKKFHSMLSRVNVMELKSTI